MAKAQREDAYAHYKKIGVPSDKFELLFSSMSGGDEDVQWGHLYSKSASWMSQYEQGAAAEEYFGEALALSKEQLALQSRIAESQIKIAEAQEQRASELWNHWKTVYQPKEIAFSETYFAGEPGEFAAGIAGAEVKSAFKSAKQEQARTLRGLGIDPSSPKYVKILGQWQQAEAAAVAGARTRAKDRIRDQNYARRRDIVAGIGRGYPSESGTAAATASSGLGQAGASYAQGYGAATQANQALAGYYQNLYGIEFQREQNQLNRQMQKSIASDQTKAAGIGGLTQGIGSIGTAFATAKLLGI